MDCYFARIDPYVSFFFGRKFKKLLIELNLILIAIPKLNWNWRMELDIVELSFWINPCVNNQEVFHLRENLKIVIFSSNYYLVIDLIYKFKVKLIIFISWTIFNFRRNKMWSTIFTEQSWWNFCVMKKKNLLNQKLNRRKEIGEPINFNFFLQKWRAKKISLSNSKESIKMYENPHCLRTVFIATLPLESLFL